MEVRDIAEYLKAIFFTNSDIIPIEELETYLKTTKLPIYSYQMLYASLLYPSYYFDIYAAPGTACDGHKVLTKSITLPKYNVYSEREECLEYEEFRLCNKWCKENIPNSAYFEDELAKYKLTIEKETVKPEKEETNIFEKLIDLYVENLIISIPVTVILVALIIFIIIRSIIRRKNRIKLDFKG